MASKADIVDHMADTAGLTKKQAAEALESALDCIGGALEDGEKVSLPGFGTFSISERAARDGRNPQTGAKLRIAASKGVRFKVAKALKDAVNS